MRIVDRLHKRTEPARRALPSSALRTSTFRKRVTYVLALVLLLSGLLWLLFEHFVRVTSDFGPVHHWLQSWWLKMHGVCALIATWGFGVLWTMHIKRYWTQRKNRRTGAAMFTLMQLLIATGAALYYANGEGLREWVSLLHWILGVVATLALIAHSVAGHRSMNPNDQ